MIRPMHSARYRTQAERDHARRLDVLRAAGKLQRWRYEALKLRLAEGRWYTPDFLVEHCDGTLEAQEVKGHHANIRDSVTRWAVAAESYPWLRWSFWQQGGTTWYRAEDLSAMRGIYGGTARAGLPVVERRRAARARTLTARA